MTWNIYELENICERYRGFDYILLEIPVSGSHIHTKQRIELGQGIVGIIQVLGSVVTGAPTTIRVPKQPVLDFIKKYKEIHQIGDDYVY